MSYKTASKPRRQTQSKLSEQKCLLMHKMCLWIWIYSCSWCLITNIELSNCYKASMIISASPSILHLIVFYQQFQNFKKKKYIYISSTFFISYEEIFNTWHFLLKINSWTGFTNRLNNDAVVFLWYLTLYIISFGESWKNHE